MISKELLEIVLDTSIDETFYYNDNLLWFESDGREFNINLYELAYNVKKWALSQNNLSAIRLCDEPKEIFEKADKLLIDLQNKKYCIYGILLNENECIDIDEYTEIYLKETK